MAETARLDLPVQSIETSTSAIKSTLEKAQQQVGFIPAMYANMANSPGVLDTYLTGYKYFRESGLFTPPEQEVIFLTISRENTCTYCVAAHSMIADKVSKVPADAVEAIRSGKPISDAKLEALSSFTEVMFQSRGRPTPEELTAFKAAGYADQHVLEIVLAIAVKTLSNYPNHIFHTEVDDRFAAYKWTEDETANQA